MQKTRFEGQLRLIRAAVRPSKMLSGLIFGAAIAVAGCVDTSKGTTGGSEVNDTTAFIRSPDGAVPPKGLELVELGMTIGEVEAILGQFHKFTRIESEVEENVITDQFLYPEDQEVQGNRVWDLT